MPVLRIVDLHVAYGSTPVLDGVSLELERGAALAVTGPNGAGKTTLLRAVSGLLDLHPGGKVTAGRIDVDVPRSEVAYVLEGRRVFRDLTVEENLRVGAFAVRSRSEVRNRVAWALDRFPQLASRHGVRAGHLSGGEQQLLVIARASLSKPRLLLLDEPSVGLAEDAVALVADVVDELRAEATALLVAEQDARLAPVLGAPAVTVQLASGRLATPATASA